MASVRRQFTNSPIHQFTNSPIATMTLKTRLSILLLSTPVVIFVVVGGLIGRASATEGDATYQHLRVFEDVLSLVISNYVEEVKVDKAMEGALKGLAAVM